MTSFIQSLAAFVAGHPILTVIIVFVSAASEAMILIGAVIPGTTIILAVAALAGAAGGLQMTAIITAAAILGAIVGDGLSYWIGHRHGGRVLQMRPFRNRPWLLERGEAYFTSHGGKSVFLARFLPGVRAVVPVAAGMAGMTVGRFYAANVSSAVVWGVSHVLPAAGFGTGLARLGSLNPRLLALLGSFVIVVAAAWFLVRSVLWRLIPVLGRWRLGLVGRLAGDDRAVVRFLRRVLSNDGGIVLPIVFAVVSVFALGSFVGIAEDVASEPALAAADLSISNFVQSLRTDPADRIMVAVTMAGDSLVLTAVALVLVGWLLAFRCWRVGVAVIVAIGGATLFVPFIKSVIQRARPNALYSGAEAFSFPSGHATLSLTILGVLAVILAHRQPIRQRVWIHTGLIVLAAAIALSRIYLGAHWPSDVEAGALFGLAVAAAFAFAIQGRELAIRPARLAMTLLVVFLAVYTVHVQRSYATWLAAYDDVPSSTKIAEADWLAGGWQRLAAHRTRFDGATGEPLTIQSALARERLSELLMKAGWRLEAAPSLSRLVSYAAGSSPPLPLYHEGRDAVLTFVKPIQVERPARLVLRAYPSGYAIPSGYSAPKPIDLIGLTQETVDPLVLGFNEVEQTDVAGSPASDLAGTLRLEGVDLRPAVAGGRRVFLLVPPRLSTNSPSGP